MKLALLSDVHGNLEALEAVLDDIAARAPGARLVCAGDVVGYGPDPEACVDRLRGLGAAFVLGNHEEMVLGRRSFDRCVYAGIKAAVWTRGQLSATTVHFLEELPPWIEVAPGVLVCHGDLSSADVYVSTGERARLALRQLEALRPGARVLVCGHTHHPAFFEASVGLVPARAGVETSLPRAEACLVNPGAVGQARDALPLARYALLDPDQGVSYVAVPYDHATTVRKLRRVGLVAQVVMPPLQGLSRHIERVKTRWARRWAEDRSPPRQAQNGQAVREVTFPRPSARDRLDLVVQRALQRSGAGSLYVRARPPQGALILLYHGVSSDADARWVDPRFDVPVAMFEAQMKFLSRARHVLSLDELMEHLERGESPPPGSVLITFDDGYRSILTTAAPILEHYKLPAVVYLATGYVSRGQSQFVDVLYATFKYRTRDELDLSGADLGVVDLRDPKKARDIYGELDRRLITAGLEARDQLLQSVVEQLRPTARPPRLCLTWDEVAHLVKLHPVIQIGVHTRDHIDLTHCSPETARAELEAGVADVRAALGVTARHFSFPFGRSDETARREVTRFGFRSAAVTEPLALVRAGTDPLALARLSAPPDMSLFPFFTSGAHPGLSRAVLRRS